MRIFAICGPIGSSIKSFAERFSAEIQSEEKVTIIDEADFLKCDKSVDYDRLKADVHNQTGIVIVRGHFLFMDAALRNKFDIKIFVQTESDTCLSNYLKNTSKNTSFPDVTNAIRQYINIIKPQNDEEINMSQIHADIFVSEEKINGVVITLLVSSVAKQKVDVEFAPRNATIFFS